MLHRQIYLPLALIFLSCGCMPESASPGELEPTGFSELTQEMNVTMSDGKFMRVGHFWLIEKATDWLKQRGMMPAGLDKSLMKYGSLFADEPFIGLPETFGQLKPKGDSIVGPLDDYLVDRHYGNDCSTAACIDIYWRKMPDHIGTDGNPNPFPNVFLGIDGQLFTERIQIMPVENAAHFPNRTDGYYEDAGYHNYEKIRVWTANVQGDRYGAFLYGLAQKFWPRNSLKPDPNFDDLGYVANPGTSYLLGAHLDIPPTYMGGNPFILSQDGEPTWPVWAMEGGDQASLLISQKHLSEAAGSIYLGWAVHLLQDMFHPGHAENLTGTPHADVEKFLDRLITHGYFDHLPTTDPSQYLHGVNGVPQLGVDSDYLDSSTFATKAEMCRAMKASLPTEERFERAWNFSKPYYKFIGHARWEGSNEGKNIAAWEVIMDFCLKETIRLIACFDEIDNEPVDNVKVATFLVALGLI